MTEFATPTKIVKTKNGDTMRINAEDFDPKIHTEVDEAAFEKSSDKLKAKAAKTPDKVKEARKTLIEAGELDEDNVPDDPEDEPTEEDDQEMEEEFEDDNAGNTEEKAPKYAVNYSHPGLSAMSMSELRQLPEYDKISKRFKTSKESIIKAILKFKQGLEKEV